MRPKFPQASIEPPPLQITHLGLQALKKVAEEKNHLPLLTLCTQALDGCAEARAELQQIINSGLIAYMEGPPCSTN